MNKIECEQMKTNIRESTASSYTFYPKSDGIKNYEKIQFPLGSVGAERLLQKSNREIEKNS